MGREIARFDWGQTSLGPLEFWPAALKVAVSAMVNSAFPKCLAWGPDLICIYNDAFVPILGNKHPCLGQSFSRIWAEAWDEVGPILERAMQGQATFIEDFSLVLERSDHPEEANFTFCYSPLRDENGVIRGMLDTVVETTGKVRAERLSQLRNRELVHRSRNAFALVSALVNQTHRTSATMEEAQHKIQERLGSLVRAQDILAETRSAETHVMQVVKRALEPFSNAPGSVEAQGSDVRIGREQVTSLALALHELGTNACKYGALSAPGGHVSVTWAIEDHGEEREFRLDWTESGGPPVTAPTRRGFGSFLIDQALEREFGGEVTLSYPPEGFRFLLATDARELTRDTASGR